MDSNINNGGDMNLYDKNNNNKYSYHQIIINYRL